VASEKFSADWRKVATAFAPFSASGSDNYKAAGPAMSRPTAQDFRIQLPASLDDFDKLHVGKSVEYFTGLLPPVAGSGLCCWVVADPI
jgi:hypothetical protein